MTMRSNVTVKGMDMVEPRLQGWERIAAVLGWTVRTAIRHRKELRECKVIFYQWLGKPPRKTVCSYESLLRFFLVTREEASLSGARGRKGPGGTA
jgi:hypothetical protein